MSRTTVAKLEARVRELEARVTALEGAPVEPSAQAPAKAPRTRKCACGREFKHGRLVSEAAAHPLGLCGLKGLSAHSA